MLWWSVVCACVAGGALAAVAPTPRYLQGANEPSQPRQLFYVQQPYSNRFAPELQRLELAVNNPENQYYRPTQQRQDVQYSDANGSKETTGKLESLEPDAELLPGAQAQQPQGPPAQAPVAPGVSGLLPGQRFYIVHPQQVFGQNPLYPSLPNGFRPNGQIPGYQRFYILQAQPGLGDGSFGPQGYQNAILIDPSTGQPLASPQIVQPNFQRLIAAQTPQQQASRVEPSKDYPEPSRNYPAPDGNFAEPARNLVENRNYPEALRGYQESQQAQFMGAQQQFGPPFAGIPPASLPFFGFGRQEIPYTQQGFEPNRNAIQFSQLVSLQPGQLPVAPARAQGAAQPAETPAQGRRDTDDYTDEEKKEDISSEANTFEESVKKTDDKSVESTSEDAKTIEDTKEETDNALRKHKSAANIQTVPKRS